MRRRFHFVGNPLAGRGRPDLADAVVAGLEAQGAAVARSRAAGPAEALAEARAAVASGGCDALVAAGGDGTIRLAAMAVAGTDTALGVVPLGTGNVLAHEAGLPREAGALAALLLHGRARQITTGTVNGELFLLMVGAGFDGRVIAGLDQGTKQRRGKLAYARPALAALACGSDRLTLDLDGRQTEAAWVIVANASRYGGRFVLTRRTGIEREGLAAVVFRDHSLGRRLVDLAAILAGRLDRRLAHATGCELVPVRRVRVTAATPVPVQVDGDAFGTVPLDIVAGGAPVRLILPPLGE